jgi:hypothetical protein
LVALSLHRGPDDPHRQAVHQAEYSLNSSVGC